MNLFVLVELGNIAHFVLQVRAAQLGNLFGWIHSEEVGMEVVVDLSHILELAEMIMLAVAVVAAGTEMAEGNYFARFLEV